ncbi:hypothetical protein ZWY2020_005655 [Hordeum vulgare]|nr:hypothetical protein ZWY2020_005655 [Hordeum vulgare]
MHVSAMSPILTKAHLDRHPKHQLTAETTPRHQSEAPTASYSCFLSYINLAAPPSLHISPSEAPLTFDQTLESAAAAASMAPKAEKKPVSTENPGGEEAGCQQDGV